jgi:hypothetical protein
VGEKTLLKIEVSVYRKEYTSAEIVDNTEVYHKRKKEKKESGGKEKQMKAPRSTCELSITS